MAYNNPFFYNKDSSVDSVYKYIDVSTYKAIYGSSVSFKSRINYLDTVDNTLKIMPASLNNLIIKYSLKFILNDLDAGNLLKTIEIAGGYKYLKFKDPSNLYLDFLGLVESYSVNKNSNALNELDIDVNAYFKAPLLKWKTSSLIANITSENLNFVNNSNYDKYDIVYTNYFNNTSNFSQNENLIDNFFIKKTEGISSISYSNFLSNFSKNFIFESKIPFTLQNDLDFYKSEYKNSFIQNLKYKQNSNSLKKFSISFQNITTKQCKAMLFFLEKRCGYRRFIYDFPMFLKKNKVFICSEWNHSFKYDNCHDLTLLLTEDPQPSVKYFTSGSETIYYL